MKEPKNIPTDEGQRVILRGRGHAGTTVKRDGKWFWVKWDEQVGMDGRAEIHHCFELEKA